MPNPWDRPPIPLRGDSDEDTTYGGIGRVVTHWEQVEIALSHLYSLFVGRLGHREAIYEYGAGAVLKGRLERLALAHEKLCKLVPDQALESEFGALIEQIRLFSERRNDVAHGMVVPMQWKANEPFQFCLVPPDYKQTHFDPQNAPLYVYTRRELDSLTATFFSFADVLTRHTCKLYEIHEQRRGLA
jgi:hypothetical protein